MDRPGVIDLRDLESPASSRAIERFVALANLAVEHDRHHQLAPPRVLLVVVPHDGEWMIRRAHPWLAEADHIVILREQSEEDERKLEADPDLREAVDDEWREALAGLSVDVIDGLTPENVREAIRLAVAASAELAPQEAPAPAPGLVLELPSTSWTAYTLDVPPFLRLRNLANRFERRDGTISLRLDGDRDAIERTAVGRDPFHPVEWRSIRTRLHWWYVARDGVCFLSQEHDDPLPAARVYGYDDNDPVQVTLAPDASVSATRFGHDVLVTSAVPIGWHRAGEVYVAAFARDPHRAIFFAQSPAHAERRASVGARLDAIDARDLAPAVVLGPDDRTRYAVDLTFAVYRVVATAHGADELTHVGGPDAGFAVFDAEHRFVRRGSGRLLGGWFRWATIEEGGHYWREDLATSERMRLGQVDAPPSPGSAVDVLAIPGARNVLLVTEGHLRVV